MKKVLTSPFSSSYLPLLFSPPFNFSKKILTPPPPPFYDLSKISNPYKVGGEEGGGSHYDTGIHHVSAIELSMHFLEPISYHWPFSINTPWTSGMKWVNGLTSWAENEILLRKLNAHKAFWRPPEHLPIVLCTFSLRPVSMGKVHLSLLYECHAIF